MATIGTTTLTSILQSYQIQIQKTESKVREIENNIRKLEDEIDFFRSFIETQEDIHKDDNQTMSSTSSNLETQESETEDIPIISKTSEPLILEITELSQDLGLPSLKPVVSEEIEMSGRDFGGTDFRPSPSVLRGQWGGDGGELMLAWDWIRMQRDGEVAWCWSGFDGDRVEGDGVKAGEYNLVKRSRWRKRKFEWDVDRPGAYGRVKRGKIACLK